MPGVPFLPLPALGDLTRGLYLFFKAHAGEMITLLAEELKAAKHDGAALLPRVPLSHTSQA